MNAKQASSGPLLYLVGQLTAGGQERQLLYLLDGLRARGFRPELAVWNYAGTDAFAASAGAAVPIHPLGPGSRLQKLLRLRALVARLKPGVLHSYSFYTNFAAAFAAAGRDVTVVGSIRDELAAQRRASGPAVGTLSATWPRTKICNSERVRANLEGAERVFVVRNGMDVAGFRATPPPAGRPHLVGVGRLVRQKRWDLLVAVAARLAQDGYDLHVTVAGEGPLRAELEVQAARLGVAARVRFMGLCHDVPALLASASLLVLTSDHEGCPNVVMEAMACGRAVVATEAGDVPFLVEHGVTGWVVPPGDEAAIAERTAALLRDPDLCARFGRAGRQRAEAQFGLARLVDETLAAYRGAGWKET